MATTKLLRIKETGGKNKASHLKKNIFYICKSEKTEDGLWIGGNAGTTPEQIYNSMILNKKTWNKETGSQGFHYMLSFAPDSDVDEELAFTIAQEFCKELLGDNYLHVFTVHNDKAHMHAHITFDSVSCSSGLKFHSPAGDWEKRIQPITDRLCEKYNLPTLDYEKHAGKGMDYGAWKNRKDETKEKYEWNDIIRDDIDIALSSSKTYEEFLGELEKEHYQLRDGKHLSLLPPGKDKPIRTKYLGAGYTKEDIIYRIKNKDKEKAFEKSRIRYGNTTHVKQAIAARIQRATFTRWQMSQLQKNFYRRWMNTYFIHKPFLKNSWKYKRDILKVKAYSDQLCYMIEHDITDIARLEKRVNAIIEQKKELEMFLQVAKTNLFKKLPMQNVYEYLKVIDELEQFPSGTRTDLEEKAEWLKQMIEEVASIDVAINNYQEAKSKYDFYRSELKETKKEFNLCSGIAKETFHAYDFDERWIQEQYKNKDAKEGNDRYYTRITINEKMFKESSDSDFTLCRIPFSKECVFIPLQHTRQLNEGKILSAYIYHDKEYKITDENGREIRREYGEKLKENYEDKTRSRKLENSIKKGV